MYSSLAEVRAATYGHIISAATTRQAFVSPSCPYALRFLDIPKSAFRQCLSEHPELSIALLKELSGQMRKLTECTKRLALMDVYGRIVATLHSMAHEEAGNTVVTQRLTHQDIADRVGASREMVSRIMRDLVLGGYLEVRDRRILIKKSLPKTW
jgi:CRP/FNR family cyclic AMP-dependent transcriptional regulator